MESTRRKLVLVLKIAVSVLIFWGLARKIDWGEFLRIATGMDTIPLLLGGLLLLPVYLVGSWRWKMLLEAQNVHLSLKHAVQISFIGNFFNAFLLGVTGGDVIKIFYATQAAPDRKSAAGLSVVVDRIIGLVALLLIGTVLGLWHYSFLTTQSQTRLALWSIFAAAGITAVVSVLILTAPHWARHPGCDAFLARLPLSKIWQNLRDAGIRYANAPGVLLSTLGISVVLHFMNFITCWLVIRALHLDLPLGPFLSIIPIVLFLIALPISLSGHGVREYLNVVFLSLLGVGTEHAVAYSLTVFALSLVWSLVGGLVYLQYKTPATVPVPT